MKSKNYKSQIFILSVSVLFIILGSSFSSVKEPEKVSAKMFCKTDFGRCTGSANCTACTSCRYCKHCSNGGTCGVCSTSTTKSSKSSDSYSNSKGASSGSSTSYYLKTLLVTSTSLNLRGGPGTNYDVLEKLVKDQELTFLSQSGDWIYVKVISSNTKGYVYYKNVGILQ